jgi:hypothetical protein
MVTQMELPFTREDREWVMIHALHDAAQGTQAERLVQVRDALRMTAKANPTIKGEALFFLTLSWLKTSRVRA